MSTVAKDLVVLVCGGRDFGVSASEQEFVWRTLDRVHQERGIRLVVQGAARGADGAAQRWALQRQVNCLSVPAKWDRYGKRAGALRNAEMLTLAAKLGVPPDVGIAFPGGVGTADMVRRLKAHGIVVWEPEFRPECCGVPRCRASARTTPSGATSPNSER